MRRATTGLPLLTAGRVIACLRVRSQRRKSLGGAELDLDLAPARVARLVAWVVSQNILVAQLHTDLRGDVRQVVQILYSEGAPAGQFRHFIEQRRPAVFLWRSGAIRGRGKNTH